MYQLSDRGARTGTTQESISLLPLPPSPPSLPSSVVSFS